jgi:excisionase family DNA binding protein
MERLWTVSDVAQFLAVNRSTVYAWVQQRRIPHIALSRGARKTCVRFREDAIRRWLKARDRVPQHPA